MCRSNSEINISWIVTRTSKQKLKQLFTACTLVSSFVILTSFVTWNPKSLRYHVFVKVLFGAKGYKNITNFCCKNNHERNWDLIPLSAKPTKWSNTLKQFVGKSRRTVWVCLNILWDWRLKGYFQSSHWQKSSLSPNTTIYNKESIPECTCAL